MALARDTIGGTSPDHRDERIDHGGGERHGPDYGNSKSTAMTSEVEDVPAKHGNILSEKQLGKFEDGEGEEIDYATSCIYNIYFRKDKKEHILITPLTSPDLDKVNPPRKKKWKGPNLFNYDDMPASARENTFFVHTPHLAFRCTPRTLRRGPRKDSPVVCLINNSWLWHRWVLQFGSALADPRVVDPRGVVSADYGARKNDASGLAAKGYKVRSWRICTESGKQFHIATNAARKAGLEDEKPKLILDAPLIDEAVFLDWHSPFTHKTRHYRFTYAGVEFYWKGTGTVREPRTCGWWLRFNHVKLCARIPVVTSVEASSAGPIRRSTTWGSSVLSRFGSRGAGFREVCLAKYTSSMSARKIGQLHVYDDALHRLLVEGIIPLDAKVKEELNDRGVVGVKKLRLYELIMATAMCMVLGEWQKRETLKAILSAAGEGAGN